MDKQTGLDQLAEVLGDKNLAIFFNAYCRNGLNAKKAYLELHPDVTEGSAEVLGSRVLGKVKIFDVLTIYGLGIDLYMRGLKEGLNATNSAGFPDYKIRLGYHTVLGRLLGLEDSRTNFDESGQLTWRRKE